MAFAAVNNIITYEIIILYLSAIFWTLGYDTIYGAQDMSDDEIIGLKSTSIKFKNNLNLFVLVSYSMSSVIILYLFKNFLGINLFTFLLIMFVISLLYQLLELKKKDSENYLRLFKFNNYSGLIMFISIYSINL